MIAMLIRKILNPKYDIERAKFIYEIKQHKETIKELENKKNLTGYEIGLLEVAKTELKALKEIGGNI